jgi:MFS family permease
MQTPGRDAQRFRLAKVYTIEALVSAGSNLLTIGVFFFMQHRFGWQMRRNFTLSAGLGLLYIFGALAAHPLTRRFGRLPPLVGAYLVIIVASLVAAFYTTPAIASAAVLIYGFCSAITWPIVENLVAAGKQDPHALSRRLALYNVVWAAVGAVVVALSGTIIEKTDVGVFYITAGVCAVAACIALFGRVEPADAEMAADAAPHLAPEPKLAQQRVLALWLSRISVPAMYLMIYALAAMLPSLPVLQPLRPAMQTAVSSVWLVARFVAFLLLGASVFWHTKPRLLLVAAAALLVSMLIITIPQDLTVMILGQILFGAATGLIYTASLYFGMVLSEGSTEHGGYHEALIGLGMSLGPAMGAITQIIRPGDSHAAVVGISSLLGISLLLASIASIRIRRQKPGYPAADAAKSA